MVIADGSFRSSIHMILFRHIHPFQQFLESRVVTEWVHERVDLDPLQLPIMFIKCPIKLGKSLVLVPECGV